jgi:hypothetical protein
VPPPTPPDLEEAVDVNGEEADHAGGATTRRPGLEEGRCSATWPVPRGPRPPGVERERRRFGRGSSREERRGREAVAGRGEATGAGGRVWGCEVRRLYMYKCG